MFVTFGPFKCFIWYDKNACSSYSTCKNKYRIFLIGFIIEESTLGDDKIYSFTTQTTSVTIVSVECKIIGYSCLNKEILNKNFFWFKITNCDMKISFSYHLLTNSQFTMHGATFKVASTEKNFALTLSLKSDVKSNGHEFTNNKKTKKNEYYLRAL
ncbi:hypothetical protein BpHYR1_012546 [Brachionus plicatilis]|uniref:Uncharacterized protein n=1 Tax=Brachionus plicatilis TaxID=10195 RepID=A0A3M7PK03_BRAPC|nr:hypothetical protein BpHYR1_012546 [Brachionus plicatilis]